jgi:hypothetical protein
MPFRSLIVLRDGDTNWHNNSPVASFIGDPNFPSKLAGADRGEKIRLYENLYQQYSRLEFTRTSDRPIAIAGLEKRVIRDLDSAHGGFGIFDDGRSLLPRSLLWQRGENISSLRRIEFPSSRPMVVPSWSWMAYEGGIDFVPMPLGGVIWLEGEDAVQGPWATSKKTWHTDDGEKEVEITSTARKFTMGIEDDREFELVYDIQSPSAADLKNILCVVVGRHNVRTRPIEDMVHYVLLIAPKLKATTENDNIYERIGVGQMPGKYINPAKVSVKVQ